MPRRSMAIRGPRTTGRKAVELRERPHTGAGPNQHGAEYARPYARGAHRPDTGDPHGPPDHGRAPNISSASFIRLTATREAPYGSVRTFWSSAISGALSSAV